MEEIKKVDTRINIEFDVFCPHCDEYSDLLDTKDVEDSDLPMFLGYGQWGKEKWNKEVTCAYCRGIFIVEDVIY